MARVARIWRTASRRREREEEEEGYVFAYTLANAKIRLREQDHRWIKKHSRHVLFHCISAPSPPRWFPRFNLWLDSRRVCDSSPSCGALDTLGYGGNGLIGKLVNNTGNDFRLIDFGREIWWKLERNFSEEIEGQGWWFANDSARKFNVEREVRLEGWLIQASSGKNLKRVERFERKILLK